MGVGPAGIGKGDVDLPGAFAVEANDPRHLDQEVGRLQADRHGAQETLLVSLAMDRRRAAFGAAIPFPGLFQAEQDTALEEVDAGLLVAPNAKGVIQQAGAHGLPLEGCLSLTSRVRTMTDVSRAQDAKFG